MKSRVLYLDILRILACLMVILMHSPQPNAVGSYVQSGISLLTSPCIGLFFMVSGALLLPVCKPTGEFLRRRLVRVALPVLLFSLFYIVAGCVASRDYDTLWRAILSVPFSAQGNPVLWFAYVLVGLYFVAPVISPWLLGASRREVEFFLLLWAVTMCYPLVRSFVDVNEGHGGILYYFGGYAGYFVLGYYMHHYDVRWKKWLLLLLYAVPLGAAAVCKLADISVDFYDLFWYLSIFVAMMTAALFLAVKELFGGRGGVGTVGKLLTDFSNAAFGIYLVHFFIIRTLLWRVNLAIIPGSGGIVETFVLAALISYAIVRLISLIPGSEYVTGYKR